MVNDGMGAFVAEAVIKQLVLAGKAPKHSKVAVLGLTFKENCPDTRNSKVEDILNRLKDYGIKPVVVDPWADEADAIKEYNVSLTPLSEIKEMDCVIFAVAHNEFKNMSVKDIDALFAESENNEKVIVDVKSIFCKKELEAEGYRYWRL